ncbi:hypothetical protein T484DRAFT_1859254 [Baffinella frigidus]|nr:hypothetical protein T484DRAFT_1859254 [Cryptophyta sp. CCMP2293]
MQFDSADLLAVHQSEDTPEGVSACSREKPHVCGTCGFRFRWKSILKEHMWVHSGEEREKPHVCGTCGKTFLCDAKRIEHERVHSGEKPYACQTCGKTFAWKGNMMKHGTRGEAAGSMAMNLSAGAQIAKQKEMRDERKRSGPGVTAPGRAAQKLIPLNLETKWKAPAPRSAQCEGCGPGKWSPSGAPSSRAWKCGPCARALEEAYMTRLERQEQLHLQREGEMVQLGVDNIALEEDKQRSAVQIDRLRILLFENEGRQATSHAYLEQLLAHGYRAIATSHAYLEQLLAHGPAAPPPGPRFNAIPPGATSHAYLEQLLAHVEQQEKQYKGGLALQNDTMGENARLHSTTEAEATRRTKCVAFAMGHHQRLGAGSRVEWLEPGVLRMVLEQV